MTDIEKALWIAGFSWEEGKRVLAALDELGCLDEPEDVVQLLKVLEPLVVLADDCQKYAAYNGPLVYGHLGGEPIVLLKREDCFAAKYAVEAYKRGKKA